LRGVPFLPVAITEKVIQREGNSGNGNGNKRNKRPPALEGRAETLYKRERAEADKNPARSLERWLRVRGYGYEDDARLLPHDAEFRKAIRDLESWKPDAYAALQRVYLSRSADPELPERWKAMARNNPHTEKGFKALMNLHHLVDARRFVLYRIHHDEERQRQRQKQRPGACAGCSETREDRAESPARVVPGVDTASAP
jgi:hypothetical protein